MAKGKKNTEDAPIEVTVDVVPEERVLEPAGFAPELEATPESEPAPAPAPVAAPDTTYVAFVTVTCFRCKADGQVKLKKGEAAPNGCLAVDCHAVEPDVSITVRKL